VLQIGAAQVLLETQDSLNFYIAQHCYEHCNSLGWFYDTFRHLYSAASFLNRNAWHQRDIGEGRTFGAAPPAAAARMSRAPLLERIVAATAGGRPDKSVAGERQRSPAVASAAGADRLLGKTRTARSWPSACSRTTARTAASIAIGCCSPTCSTPPCTASTVISSSAAAATAAPWGSQPSPDRPPREQAIVVRRPGRYHLPARGRAARTLRRRGCAR